MNYCPSVCGECQPCRKTLRGNTFAVAWFILALTILVAAVYFSVPAKAISLTRPVTVVIAVGWDGGVCQPINEPDPATGRTTIIRTMACNLDHAVAITYTAPAGSWVGADPAETGAAVACQLEINGETVVEDSGYTDVSCLVAI